MEGFEQESWIAKSGRIRGERKQQYGKVVVGLSSQRLRNSGSLPAQLFEIAAENITKLGLAWREVFSEYWMRHESEGISRIRDRERKAIASFFDAETLKIESEILEILKRPSFRPFDSELFNQARDSIVSVCQEVGPQCQALVERLAADATRKRKSARSERWWRWAEVVVVSILAAAGSAIVAQYNDSLGEKHNQAQLAAYREQAAAVKLVGEKLAERETILNKVSPPFALVGSDGRIKYQEDRFEKYGLTVSVNRTPWVENGEIIEDSEKQFGWKYQFKFKKTPHKVLVFTQSAALPSVKLTSPSLIDVSFIDLTRMGQPSIKSDSIVQLLEPSER